MKKISTAFVILLFLFLLSFLPVYAASIPNFPSCVNPQGTLKVSYSSGTHGVPGYTNPYQGSDSVYSVTADSLIQCLCLENGDGIQTNWWKIPELSSSEIETFKSQGWIFVPDGSVWGLDPVAYLAKNISFSCKSSVSGGSTGGSSSSSPSTSSVLGEILSLASTGNINFIIGIAGFGIISLLLSYLLKNYPVAKKK